MSVSVAVIMLAATAAQPVGGNVTAEQAFARARALTSTAICKTDNADDEIVVCGRRNNDTYRVPSTDEGGQAGDLRGRAGEVPSASPDRLATGRCGIFAGERRCSKAEAELYGYYRGRDPISAIVGIGKALLDPE